MVTLTQHNLFQSPFMTRTLASITNPYIYVKKWKLSTHHVNNEALIVKNLALRKLSNWFMANQSHQKWISTAIGIYTFLINR